MNTIPLPHLVRVLLPLCAAALALAGAVPGSAAAGTYAVAIPATSGYPGWSSPGVGTAPFRVRDRGIDTDGGTYPAGSSRKLRLDAPADLRFASVRVSGSMQTPNDAFLVHGRQGTRGGAVASVFTSRLDGPYAITYTAADWIDLGLEAEQATVATSHGANSVTMAAIEAVLTDDVDPEVELVQVPDPAGWIGADRCVPLSWRESDRGSGISSATLTNATTGQTLASWTETSDSTLAPGAALATRSTCVPAAQQRHGTNVLRVRVVDWSGRARVTSFQARFDLELPQVIGAPQDGVVRSEAQPSFAFAATDADSGIAHVEATIGGQAAPITPAPGGYVAAAPRPLAVGDHVLRLVARDGAGNIRLLARTIRVVDVAAPVLAWSAPAEAGGPSPSLQVTGSDASGLAPASWQVTVDGRSVAATGSPTRVVADLEQLAPGAHTLEVRVLDVHGNAAATSRRYEVTTAPVSTGRVTPTAAATSGTPASGAPAITAPNGPSALTILDAPSGPVTWGARVRVVASAVEGGRPLAGRRVVLRQAGAEIAHAIADGNGRVELLATVRRPGALEVFVPGSTIRAAAAGLQVAPLVALQTSTTRPRADRAFTVRGRVQPGAFRGKLTLEARLGGTWYPLRRTITVGAGGRFRTTATAAATGTVAVRVRIAARDGWAAGTSNEQVLTVRR